MTKYLSSTEHVHQIGIYDSKNKRNCTGGIWVAKNVPIKDSNILNTGTW